MTANSNNPASLMPNPRPFEPSLGFVHPDTSVDDLEEAFARAVGLRGGCLMLDPAFSFLPHQPEAIALLREDDRPAADNDSELESEADSGTKVDSEPEVHPGPKIEPEPQVQPMVEVEIKNKAEIEVQPKIEVEPEIAAKPEPADEVQEEPSSQPNAFRTSRPHAGVSMASAPNRPSNSNPLADLLHAFDLVEEVAASIVRENSTAERAEEEANKAASDNNAFLPIGLEAPEIPLLNDVDFKNTIAPRLKKRGLAFAGAGRRSLKIPRKNRTGREADDTGSTATSSYSSASTVSTLGPAHYPIPWEITAVVPTKEYDGNPRKINKDRLSN